MHPGETEDTTLEGARGDAVRLARVAVLLHALDRKTVRQDPSLCFPLPPGRPVRIGRGVRDRVVDGSREVRLALADRSVSQRHATLSLTRERGRMVAWVADDGSRNGTWVDGQRVSEARLSDRTRLRIGPHTFVLREVPAGWLTFDRERTRAYLGQGPAVHLLYERLTRIAATPVPVLLHGATGTGKEVLARELHRASGRTGPYVGLNCDAIPENLIESELFGHVRGAFSGASRDKEGRVAAADGGTLLLDEVGDMPGSVQVRLLRMLQEGEVVPVGATRPRSVDVRVVAASHHELADQVREGAFRADLYARLKGLVMEVPPLVERPEDVGILFEEGLRRAGVAAGSLRLTTPATEALFACGWSHNARQVMQVASVAAALAEDGTVGVEQLQGLDDDPGDVPGVAADAEVAAVLVALRRRKEAPEEFAQALGALMRREKGGVTRVAAALGYSRMQVYRWLREAGVDR